MDTSEVRRIVEALLVPLRRALRLSQWTVHTTYESSDCRGQCVLAPAYREATINIDPERFDPGDTAAVEETLLHELLHLINADFETYRAQVKKLTHNRKAFKAIDVMFVVAAEQAVMRFMRLLGDGLGMGAAHIVKAAKRNEHAVACRRQRQGKAAT